MLEILLDEALIFFKVLQRLIDQGLILGLPNLAQVLAILQLPCLRLLLLLQDHLL